MHDPGDRILLPRDAGFRPLRLLGEFGERAADLGALPVQFAQLAIGVADRALGFAQLIGGLGARLFGTDQFLLERLQPLAQRLQFLFRGGERVGARNAEGEQRNRNRA